MSQSTQSSTAQSLDSKCSICPNQCTLISTTKKKWNVCQAVMLNTALFCIPTHNEACHIYSLLLLAFVFCIALSSLQKSTKSYDWRESNKLVSLTGTAPVWAALCGEDPSYPSLGVRPENKTSFNLKWTVHLCNVWLQIMKGTCKKAKEAF